MISVIIPVYNVIKYVEDSIESVLCQSYKDFEIILVDDGSTDGSGEVCDRYAQTDKRIKVIHQQNKGLGAARNVGLQAVTGDLVMFLDSDDLMLWDAIESTKGMMDTTGADIVVCNYKRFSGKAPNMPTQRHSVGKLYDKKKALMEYIQFKVFPVAWGKLYKRELFDGLSYTEGRYGESMVPTYNIIRKASRVYITNEQLFMYRRRADSITEKAEDKMSKDFLFAHMHLKSLISQDTPDIFTQDEFYQLIRIIDRRIIAKGWSSIV